MLHLIFKIGIRRDAEVLRGVCAGFSTEGIPVAGKIILVRRPEEEFSDLSLDTFHLKKDSKKEGWPKGVIQALQKFEENYLMVIPGKGFDLDESEE